MRTPQRGQSGRNRNDEGRPARTPGRPARPDQASRSDQPAGSRPGRPPRPEQGSRTERTAGPRPARPSSGGTRPATTRPAGSRPQRGERHKTGKSGNPLLIVRGDPLYGRNAVLECLRARHRSVSHLWIAEGLRPDDRLDEISELATRAGITIDVVPRPMLDDILQGLNHQGVLLEVGDYVYADLDDVIARPGTILVLDHLQDPQNFGTLLRASEAAGIAGVVIAADRSVSVTPAVVNASAGAVEHLVIAQVANIARAIEKIEDSGRWIVGLDDGEDAQDLFATDVPTPVALVVGAEGAGISAGIRRKCQMILSLPMLGEIESLNAATAGSIAIYDMLRRERLDGHD